MNSLTTILGLTALSRQWIFLILVAALIGFAPPVRASCGNYIHSTVASGKQLHQDSGRFLPPIQPPCRGLACERGGERQPLTPPVASPVRIPETALADVGSSLRVTASRMLTVRDESGLVIHRCFPPERPPRV